MPSLSNLIELDAEEQQHRGLEYTPREIAQQPDTWETTYAIFLKHRDRLAEFFERAGVRGPVEQRPVVVLVGAGTSDYIGQALVLLLRKQWECEVVAIPSTDLLMNAAAWLVPGKRYLWISFSRSGNSPEGVAVLRQALELYPSVAHLVVTCNGEAQMLREIAAAPLACSVVLDDAVNDRSLAMTSSFTNMVVMGQCLAHTWSVEPYATTHRALVKAARGLLSRGGAAAEAVAEGGTARACFIGSGALHSVARESALKVLEMTAGQVETMSETILGLRHGPMAALNSRTLFVCFAPGEKRQAMYARDLLTEVGEKGIVAQRVVLGPEALRAEFASAADRYIAVDEGEEPGAIADVYRPVLDVIFGQLLGLLSSVARGLQPDAPSPSGVITRVVQPFQIY